MQRSKIHTLGYQREMLLRSLKDDPTSAFQHLSWCGTFCFTERRNTARKAASGRISKTVLAKLDRKAIGPHTNYASLCFQKTW